MPMSPTFQRQVNQVSEYRQVTALEDILKLEDADIFLDELLKFFPAQGQLSLSNEQLHFLTQGAKSGVSIYATTQDFSQVHKQFRLLTNEVYVVTKIIGSPRPVRTAPPVKRIWGVCVIRQVNPASFKGDSVSMETVGMAWPFFIRKADTERYDTSYKVPLSRLPDKLLRKQIEYFPGDEETEPFRKEKFI